MKFITVALTFLITALFSTQSLAIGFSSGNAFQATLISGNLTMFCPGVNGGAQQTSYFSCRAGLLEPVEYDYFTGPQNEADTVILTVTREDGSIRAKTEAYNGNLGRSKGRFNLWISSLTQRPLLADGKNVVSYKLTKEGKVIDENNFIVSVSRQPTAVCSPGVVNAPSAQDCQNQYTACGRYFEEKNYCQ